MRLPVDATGLAAAHVVGEETVTQFLHLTHHPKTGEFGAELVPNLR